MVRDFVRGIGVEARQQCLDLTGAAAGRGRRLRRRRLQRDRASSTPSSPTQSVRLYGFEAGGDGVATGRHAASITGGSAGVLHGTRTYVLQDDDGQTIESHSISAGLDYPGVGPEHAWLHDTGRAALRAGRPTPRRWPRSSCSAAPRASSRRSRARTRSPAPSRSPRSSPPSWAATPTIVVNLSGRGDKDVHTAGDYFGILDKER